MGLFSNLFNKNTEIEKIDINDLISKIDFENINQTVRSKPKSSNQNDIKERIKITKRIIQNDKKYESITTRHYQLLDLIKEKYTKAINKDNIFNKEANQCIKFCIQDLLLAPKMIEYWKNESEIRGEIYNPLNYASHKYLLKLLEKQKRYAEAIQLCQIYIKLGLTNDGTKGGIVKRLENFKKIDRANK